MSSAVSAPPPRSVLLVDDEASVLRLLSAQIDDVARVFTASSAEEAMEILRRTDVDLLVTDLRMPGLDGLAFLQQARQRDPDLPVIVVTAFGSIESAVEAMRAGAFDYLTKPVEMKVFRQGVLRALDFRRLREENLYLRERLGEEDAPEVIGVSPEMLLIKRRAREIASSPGAALITGESGTGKGILARSIHALSGRTGLFVHVNCAALPEALLESELFGHVRGAFTGALRNRKGKFALADGGTIFLDEIGSMPLALQSKLLHVLDDGVFTPIGADAPHSSTARVLAATNEELEAAIEAGRFRRDLYWRLAVFSLEIPPLRSRRDDIAILAQSLLVRLAPARQVSLSREAAAELVTRSWPGNVRELSNVLQRALARYPDRAELPVEAFADLVPGGEEGYSLKEVLARTERSLLAEALRRTAGRKAEAAEILGLSPRMMSYYLEKYPELDR